MCKEKYEILAVDYVVYKTLQCFLGFIEMIDRHVPRRTGYKAASLHGKLSVH